MADQAPTKATKAQRYNLPDIDDLARAEIKKDFSSCDVAKKADAANVKNERWKNETAELVDFNNRLDFFTISAQTGEKEVNLSQLKLKTIPGTCAFQLRTVVEEQIERRKHTPLK